MKQEPDKPVDFPRKPDYTDPSSPPSKAPTMSQVLLNELQSIVNVLHDTVPHIDPSDLKCNLMLASMDLDDSAARLHVLAGKIRVISNAALTRALQETVEYDS